MSQSRRQDPQVTKDLGSGFLVLSQVQSGKSQQGCSQGAGSTLGQTDSKLLVTNIRGFNIETEGLLTSMYPVVGLPC